MSQASPGLLRSRTLGCPMDSLVAQEGAGRQCFVSTQDLWGSAAGAGENPQGWDWIPGGTPLNPKAPTARLNVQVFPRWFKMGVWHWRAIPYVRRGFLKHFMLTGSQIRRTFLDFFIEKGHREVRSVFRSSRRTIPLCCLPTPG